METFQYDSSRLPVRSAVTQTERMPAYDHARAGGLILASGDAALFGSLGVLNQVSFGHLGEPLVEGIITYEYLPTVLINKH